MSGDPLAGDRWVDDRLAALTPRSEWTPDGGRTLARLRARSLAKTRERAMAARRWMWTTLVAASAGIALLLLPASRACAEQPGRCVQRVLGVVGPASHSPAIRAVPEIREPVPAPRVSVSPAPAVNIPVSFKEAGAASAPVSVEIYIDYACAHCEAFVRDVVPLLTEQYVATGKVKLLYRDYPLPTHRYAKVAARYADTAGELGYYEVAMKQLFATREVWSATGEIGAQLAEVLPADVMEKLRDRMQNDPDPDSCLSADVAAGHADHLDRTPFVVIAAGGTRQAIIDGPLTFEVLKRNLDRSALPIAR